MTFKEWLKGFVFFVILVVGLPIWLIILFGCIGKGFADILRDELKKP